MKLVIIPAIAFLALSLTACDRTLDTVVVNGNQPAQVSQGYDNGNYQQQPVYVQQPSTVVVERDHSNDVLTGVATGMLLHHALSGGYGGGYNGSHYSNNNHTTIVNNHYNTVSTTSNSRSYSNRPSTSIFSSRKSYTAPARTSSMRMNSSYSRSSFSSSRARSPMSRH